MAIRTTSSPCCWAATPRASPTATTSRSGATPKFQDAVNKAAEITDQAERTKLYQEAQKIVTAEVPWLNIAHSTVFEPIRKEVTGYKVSPLGAHEFHNVDVAE